MERKFKIVEDEKTMKLYRIETDREQLIYQITKPLPEFIEQGYVYLTGDKPL